MFRENFRRGLDDGLLWLTHTRAQASSIYRCVREMKLETQLSLPDYLLASPEFLVNEREIDHDRLEREPLANQIRLLTNHLRGGGCKHTPVTTWGPIVVTNTDRLEKSEKRLGGLENMLLAGSLRSFVVFDYPDLSNMLVLHLIRRICQTRAACGASTAILTNAAGRNEIRVLIPGLEEPEDRYPSILEVRAVSSEVQPVYHDIQPCTTRGPSCAIFDLLWGIQTQ